MSLLRSGWELPRCPRLLVPATLPLTAQSSCGVPLQTYDVSDVLTARAIADVVTLDSRRDRVNLDWPALPTRSEPTRSGRQRQLELLPDTRQATDNPVLWRWSQCAPSLSFQLEGSALRRLSLTDSQAERARAKYQNPFSIDSEMLSCRS